MDESAEQLFQQLGGVSAPELQKSSAQPQEAQPGVLPDQDNQLDRWRMLLVELAYLVNASFQDAHYWEGVKAEKDTFRQLMQELLSRIQGGMDQISAEVLDDFVLNDDEVKFWSIGRKERSGPIG